MSMLQTLAAKAASNAGEMRMIPVDDLVPSEKNFYRLCDIDALADSIAANGLEQNLVVKADTNGKYRLVTGHRRLEAIRRLRNRGVKIEKVPCIVRPKESNALEMLRMIASNQYRELSDYEKMQQTQLALAAVKELKAAKVEKVGEIPLDGPVRDTVSRLTGMSGPTVSKYSGISEHLTAALKEKMKLGLLPFTVAYSASKLPKEWQQEILEKAGTAAITDQMVRDVSENRAVKEALYGYLGDKIDPDATAAENEAYLETELCRSHTGYSGIGCDVHCDPDKIMLGGGPVRWSVTVTPHKFVSIALEKYSELCVGRWKRKKVRENVQVEQEKAEPKERADIESSPTSPPAGTVENGASRTPPPVDEPVVTEPPADTVPETHVESGRFGQLRNTLSGKAADLDDTAWDEHLVWRKEPPVEDVQAVVRIGYSRVAPGKADKVSIGWWGAEDGRWFHDESHGLALETPVLGWFKVPEWKE